MLLSILLLLVQWSPLYWDNPCRESLKRELGLLSSIPLPEVTVFCRCHILFTNHSCLPSLVPLETYVHSPCLYLHLHPSDKKKHSGAEKRLRVGRECKQKCFMSFLARCLSCRMPDPDFSVNDVRLCVGECLSLSRSSNEHQLHPGMMGRNRVTGCIKARSLVLWHP